VLEELVGTTETLTREFKSYRALVWDTKTQRKGQIAEAAKDVAAMANEQVGEIIYGIEEDKEGTRRWAKRVEDGFETSHAISREWFIQTMRAHISPPLAGLEAVDVRLEGGRIALVVIVPQATGVARQNG
jgi:predicted HTH transcriptional regulator